MTEKQVAFDIRGMNCQMTDTHNQLVAENFVNRVRTCMPWQNGVMTHLLRQFTTFKTIGSVADAEAADYVTKYKDQNSRVSKCDFGQDEIGFLSAACWHDDAEMVLLKPWYKFNLMTAPNKQVCTITHRTTAGALQINEDDLPNYRSASSRVDFIPQGANIKQSTECKYRAKDPAGDWIKYFGIGGYLLSFAVPEKTLYKKIQFYDYTIAQETLECNDFVSQSCIDNVYSFYGKACKWVSASKKENGLLLSTLLQKWPLEDHEAFFAYGRGNFGMDVSSNKYIEIYFTDVNYGPHYKFTWYEGWRHLAPTSRLYVTERNGFSCSGCPDYAQAPKPGVGISCGVPQQCMTCAAWQRVVQDGTNSVCDPPFKLRTCANCGQHEVRKAVCLKCDSFAKYELYNYPFCMNCPMVYPQDKETETVCEACPALAPMRRVGTGTASAYNGDEKCEECNHTQYFDKTNANGCLYFMSVADGLTFTGGVRFDRAYVDQYKPVGSTRAPQAVPALKYRNLMPDGNRWDVSSIASNCEPSMFPDFNYPGILTRNVRGKRIQYRRWCGHDEMLKDNNAQLQWLRICYVYPNRISLQDANNMQNTVIDKERVHLNNRVAEIKLTNTLNNVECHYEILREGRTDDCTYCNGTFYTKDCGPTYSAGLETPKNSGPGTCEKCDEQCVNAEHFFEASEFSCWSNGSSRVSGSVQYGSVTRIAEAMSTTRNYWYKQAVCVACKKLTAASVPQIVTRCGNKATFEVWHPTLQRTVLQVNRPRRRACCAIDSIYSASGEYSSELGTRCVTEAEDGSMDIAKLASGSTPLCQTYVPDLSTASMPFCPPGWFFDESVAGCGRQIETWDQKCCSPCSSCATAGSLKTNEYKLCSGDTAKDTQLAGCVTSCAEKNYQLGNDTCVACESCG